MAHPLVIALRTQLGTLLTARAARRVFYAYLALAALIGVLAAIGTLERSDLQRLRVSTIDLFLPIVAVVLSELALREGMDHRTLLYPLLGPVPRWLLALTRTGVVASIVIGAMLAPVVVLGATMGVASEQIVREAGAVILGGFCYVGLFGLLHLLTRRGLVAGLAFYAVFDYQLARVPLAIRKIAPLAHVRSVAGIEEIFTFGLPIEVPAIPPLVSSAVLVSLGACALLLTVLRFHHIDLAELT